MSRDLAARGHRVVGLDASPTLLRLAREEHPEGEYVLGDAAALPFEDGTFDLVVAFNSLMDVQDMPGAVAEAARVLEPGGRICVCVTHPTADAGGFESPAPDARFVIDGDYFATRRVEVTEEKNGLAMTFRGWAYPLEAYARALEDAGLLVEAIREPRFASPGRQPVPLEPRADVPPAARGAAALVAAPARPELGEPGDDAEADPDRRQQDVEDEVRDDEDQPPERPVAQRHAPLRQRLPPHARTWSPRRSSITRRTRWAVSSIESSEMSITGQPSRRCSFRASSSSS